MYDCIVPDALWSGIMGSQVLLLVRLVSLLVLFALFILVGFSWFRRRFEGVFVASLVVWSPVLFNFVFWVLGASGSGQVLRLTLYSLFIWLFAVWRRNCEIGLWDVPLILTVWLPAEFGLLGGAKLIAGFDMGDLAPLVSGCYGFIFLRGFNVGIDYLKIDWKAALKWFLVCGALLVPLGLAIGFIQPGLRRLEYFPVSLILIYIGVGLPEEILFRGVIHELCERVLKAGVSAGIVSSIIFGMAHLNNAPAPNFRYAFLAGIAGYLYLKAYLEGNRNVATPALTHALVDTVWSHLFSG